MRTTALTAALVLGLAPLALAGGIACQLTLDKSLLAPDEKGVVTLALGIERASFDCGGTGFIGCDPERPGPKVWIERLEPKVGWKRVEAPWAEPLNTDWLPRSLTHPYRIDRGDRLRFSRRVVLSAGRYRTLCEVKRTGDGHVFTLASSEFTIEPSAAADALRKTLLAKHKAKAKSK